MFEKKKKTTEKAPGKKKSSLLEKNTGRTSDPTRFKNNLIFKIPADTDFEFRPWKAHLYTSGTRK